MSETATNAAGPSAMATITVDDRSITAEAGANLLRVCLDNGIYIPNLCYMDADETPHASCRLCFVQIAGAAAPAPACAMRVTEGLTIRTDTEPARRLQRAGLRLLLSAHKIECKSCHANRRCALQDIARFLKVKLSAGELSPLLHPTDVDDSHPLFTYYPNRCVRCGKCIRVCLRRHGRSVLTFAGRGIKMVVSHFGAADLERFPCGNCGDCLEICPVGALAAKKD